jgi:hypothetical protein
LHYTSYVYYTNYTYFIHYFQVRVESTVDLDIADHGWQDTRAIIAQSVDNLGDQFRPAMRAGWLKYICNAYPNRVAVVAGPAVGEGPLVLHDGVTLESILMFVTRNTKGDETFVMEVAVGLISGMKTNPNHRIFMFCNNEYNVYSVLILNIMRIIVK